MPTLVTSTLNFTIHISSLPFCNHSLSGSWECVRISTSNNGRKQTVVVLKREATTLKDYSNVMRHELERVEDNYSERIAR